MDERSSELDRFEALSDGIFAVIITIMVLDLKRPSQHNLQALLALWPDFISYVVSYAFIAVVWLNHHFVFRHARRLTGLLACANFANLFCISLIPFATAWLASSSIASLPLTAYGAVFLGVELTYIVLMRASFGHAPLDVLSRSGRRLQWLRAWIMVAVFAFVTLAYFVPPLWRLGLLAAFLVLHSRPDPGIRAGRT